MTKKDSFAVVFTDINYNESLRGIYDSEEAAQARIPDSDDSQNYDIITLSANQRQFVEDAREQGLDIDWGYSGRGMYGKTCPAVSVGRDDDRFNTTAKVREDSLGLGSVIYAQF